VTDDHELVGHVTARQIRHVQRALSDAVRDALWNERMSHGHYPPDLVRKDLNALLEAAGNLIGVLEEHIRPRCTGIMPGGITAWRCSRADGHRGRHGDGLVSW